VWQARAQVGQPYRDTPVFRDSMRYLEFNPTWTVPPTILREDILPKIKRDPGYLAERNMQVLERSGRPVDVNTIDWPSVSARNFPYMLRQGPGPDNALGRVKFMFPNAHAIYIHDTPSKRLFTRSERTFSSGCIRVERPFELAELVLDDPVRWDQQGIQQVLDSGRTQRVNLKEPLPVLILYWTAEADANGRVHFRKDVYGRDERVLEALNGEFRFVAPDV
jgi:murein L,D-transpeptidase YcbB/YkuD